jgi:hypothetical protein
VAQRWWSTSVLRLPVRVQLLAGLGVTVYASSLI